MSQNTAPKKLRILHFSPHDEDCGVGKYQENYLRAMDTTQDIQNDFFEVSPYQTRVMSPEEVAKVAERLSRELREYDIFHIQHEFGLFWFDQFKQIVDAGARAGVKVIVTVHLSPGFAIKTPSRGGLGPRSLLKFVRDKRHYEKMVAGHVTPLLLVDKVIVHNQVTLDSLVNFGVSMQKIVKLPHPVYDVADPEPSTRIAQMLSKQDGDIIYCITGFLHKKKGVLAAVRALKFLPVHYKLALLGGVKADSDDVEFEDRIANLIDQLGLHERVYIAGYVPTDSELNALVRECDVCVYPYDKIYYSNLSSGSLNLSFANGMPAIAYPTETLKELAHDANGALILTENFSYYEIARELLRIDISKQRQLSKKYAVNMAWAKMSKVLVRLYREV